MKISISRQALLDAVNKVKTVVSPKSALPILSHILMETRDGAVRLTATDLKVSIECSVDCTVEEAGALTVSSQRLASILAELPEGDLTLTLGSNSVIALDSGRIHTKLFSMAADEFPPIRSFDNIEPLVLPQRLLKRLFQKTSFAICSDQARYNLTGLLCEIHDGKLTVVATDGRRMSLCSESEGIPESVSVKVIIPGKMISELERLLGDEGEVNVYIDETQAAFSFASIRLVTALIEGSFPNYDMVVPKKHDKEAVLNTASFLEAVRRTRTMTNEKFNSVRFSIEGETLTLQVVTPEVGEYEEDMPVDFRGSAVEIAFNPDFILEVLRRIDTEKICLVLKDGTSPGLIKPYDGERSEGYLNVIMPIRI
ncbi:MAG: DNA polymerase III subunit beta [Candidatus Hydrogenedentes bacterium]|nr:DNA polymerase III subunit beta [Candidatus Hydrogenedentota bacterium]